MNEIFSGNPTSREAADCSEMLLINSPTQQATNTIPWPNSPFIQKISLEL